MELTATELEKPNGGPPQSAQKAMAGSRPRRVKHVSEHELEDELILYDPDRDAVHVLSPTGAEVWWLCNGRRSPQEIAAELARLYGVDAEVVSQDVDELLCRLGEARLLVGG